MPYFPQPFPGRIDDVDALRRQTEEEFDRLSRAYADDERLGSTDLTAIRNDITTLQGDVTTLETAVTALQNADTALDTRLDKLENVQFGRVYLNANQTGLASATYTKINFGATDFDPSGIWDNVNKQFKPTVAGYYMFMWQAQLLCAGGTFVYLADLFKNGSRCARGASTIVNTTTTAAVAAGSSIHRMNGTTDTMEVRGYIEGTASRDIIAGIDVTAFMLSLLKAD